MWCYCLVFLKSAAAGHCCLHWGWNIPLFGGHFPISSFFINQEIYYGRQVGCCAVKRVWPHCGADSRAGCTSNGCACAHGLAGPACAPTGPNLYFCLEYWATTWRFLPTMSTSGTAISSPTCRCISHGSTHWSRVHCLWTASIRLPCTR